VPYLSLRQPISIANVPVNRSGCAEGHAKITKLIFAENTKGDFYRIGPKRVNLTVDFVRSTHSFAALQQYTVDSNWSAATILDLKAERETWRFLTELIPFTQVNCPGTYIKPWNEAAFRNLRSVFRNLRGYFRGSSLALQRFQRPNTNPNPDR